MLMKSGCQQWKCDRVEISNSKAVCSSVIHTSKSNLTQIALPSDIQYGPDPKPI